MSNAVSLQSTTGHRITTIPQAPNIEGPDFILVPVSAPCSISTLLLVLPFNGGFHSGSGVCPMLYQHPTPSLTLQWWISFWFWCLPHALSAPCSSPGGLAMPPGREGCGHRSVEGDPPLHQHCIMRAILLTSIDGPNPFQT